MYALKARDKYHKREKEREEDYREERRARAREDHAHHHHPSGQTSSDTSVVTGAVGGGRGKRKEPSTCQRDAKYMGTFSLQMGSGWKKNMTKPVKQQLSRINPKDTTHAVDVKVSVNMDGVKVISDDGTLIMAHALHRILLSSAEAKKCLFAMVARNPQTDPQNGVYCHIFLLKTKEEANELGQLVGKAFKTAFEHNSFKREGKKPTATPGLLDGLPSHLPSARPKPWTVTSQTTPTGHTHLEPNSRPPPYAPNTINTVTPPSNVNGEAGSLEVELLSLHSQLYQLETRQAQMTAAGHHDDQNMLQIIMEVSSLQQQIEEKGKRLHHLQSAGSHGNSVTGATAGYNDVAMATVPDLETLTLDDAEWFQAGLPREIVIELLSQQPEGAFFVRESSSSVGSYALSMVALDGVIKHFLIEERNGQFCISLTGRPQPLFPSLPALILHHTLDNGPLPCPLSLATTNPIFSANEDSTVADGLSAEFIDYHDYHLLN